jgi:hypothetical protein
MAFTDAQKVKIRVYLGVPSINRFRDPRLEGALDVVGADPEAAAEVLAILAKLATVETALDDATSTAGLKRADEVEWYPGKGQTGSAAIDAQRNVGRRWCSRLSQLLGVPIVNDAFGTLGHGGDWFFGRGAQGTGGMTPLG